MVLAGEGLTRAIDEVPIIALAMACAEGRSEIRDASELRVKESDRLAAIAHVQCPSVQEILFEPQKGLSTLPLLAPWGLGLKSVRMAWPFMGRRIGARPAACFTDCLHIFRNGKIVEHFNTRVISLGTFPASESHRRASSFDQFTHSMSSPHREAASA